MLHLSAIAFYQLPGILQGRAPHKHMVTTYCLQFSLDIAALQAATSASVSSSLSLGRRALCVCSQVEPQSNTLLYLLDESLCEGALYACYSILLFLLDLSPVGVPETML